MENPHFKDIFNHLNLQVLAGSLFVGDNSWRHDRIVSPFNRLYWMMDGEGTVEYGRGQITLSAGHAYLIPAGLSCNYRCRDRLVKFYLHANVRLFGHEDVFEGLGRCLETEWPVERSQIMARLAQDGDPASLLYLKAMVMETLATFLSQAGTRPDGLDATRSRYGRVLRLIAENPAEVTPAILADQMNLPQAALERAFRRDMGITLRQYIRNNLLENVKIRLQTSDVPVRTIAAEAGFGDEFYFSRFFRQQTGEAPSGYRKRNRMM